MDRGEDLEVGREARRKSSKSIKVTEQYTQCGGQILGKFREKIVTAIQLLKIRRKDRKRCEAKVH